MNWVCFIGDFVSGVMAGFILTCYLVAESRKDSK